MIFVFSEIIDLNFSDIDFISGTLKLGKAKRHLANKEKVSITINHESLALLERIRDKYLNDTWVFQAENGDDQRNKKHRSLSLQSVMNTINQNTEHKLSFNNFRHAYATNYLRDMLDIKGTSGHTSINMTSTYIKSSIKNE